MPGAFVGCRTSNISAQMQSQKLAGLSGVIREICDISGNAGLSYGVLHKSQVFTEHFGYRDVEAKIEADDNTLYYIGSLTKAITAAAIGILVDNGKVAWDTPVKDVVPEFKQQTESLNAGTVTDLLAHRMGFASKNCFWIQGNQRLVMSKDQQIPTCNYLEPVVPFRSKWKYSNWGYALAGEMIERLSGESYGSFLESRIFKPLGMHRTTADTPADDNLAYAYMVHDNGTPAKIPRPEIDSSSVIGAAGGVKSSIADLLLFYKSILSTYTQDTCGNSSSASVLKQVETIFKPHIVIGDNPIDKLSYSLGWVHSQLPGALGLIGMNDMYLGSSMPLVGKSLNKVVLHHNGNLSGFLASIMIIPETETAIVVLGNSMPFTDPPDLVGQLLLESLLEEPVPNDYVQLARKSRAAHEASYVELAKNLEAEKGTPSSRLLEQYTGRYFNSIGNFVIEITPKADRLLMVVQDIDVVSYDLFSYSGETFCWGPPDREAEEAGQAMFPRAYTGFHKVLFQSQSGGNIDSLVWAYDPDIPTASTEADVPSENFEAACTDEVKGALVKAREESEFVAVVVDVLESL
ncbi:beta-lactamase/transpeptidase-like protein [Cadophora sp. DSE1049]|nr:beta-lactamase/transpeptidase-like protein [Cadophora sp. DSE1049]